MIECKDLILKKMLSKITREQLLAKIKEFLDGNQFLNTDLYQKFEKLDEQRLKQVLLMLFDLEEKRKQAGDDKIKEDFKKINEQAGKIIKEETRKFLKEEEGKIHKKEVDEAEKLVTSL